MPPRDKDQEFGERLVAEWRRAFLLRAQVELDHEANPSKAAVLRNLLRAHDGAGDLEQAELLFLLRVTQSERFWTDVMAEKSHPQVLKKKAEQFLRLTKPLLRAARRGIELRCCLAAGNRDVDFFVKLAKAVEITVRDYEANSNQAHIIESYLEARRVLSRFPTVREVALQVKKSHPSHERQDERTVRFVCKELGLRCAAGRPGRPKK